VLEFQEVHTYYGNSHILQGVSFKVDEGTVAVLLGRNGMGKTTTLRSAIGFTHPMTGRILFKGEEVTRFTSYQIAKRGMALVPQGCRIFSSLTVRENLLIASRKGKEDQAWTLEKVFNLFPIIQERQANRGNQLSGGERQMLAISRALISNPDLLLMDEPSEGLAPLIIQEVGKVIEKLKFQGLSIFLAEQNFSFALGIADQVYILHKGIVVFKGSSEELERNREIQDQYLAI
jgi:branched-chain amino acid transport system ATP-binding protein